MKKIILLLVGLALSGCVMTTNHTIVTHDVQRPHYIVVNAPQPINYGPRPRPAPLCRWTQVPIYGSRTITTHPTSSDVIAGTIIGGAIGNQLGNGSGRNAATIAGAIIGGSVVSSPRVTTEQYISHYDREYVCY
jgi:uncharacterized protein YcfJ